MKKLSMIKENKITEKEDTPAVKLWKELLISGYERGASDIHIEPREHQLVIRMRMDGLLMETMRVEKELHQPLITCAKLEAGMDIAEKRIPQDGHCKMVIRDVELNLRASVVPSIYGEKMVLRFLNTETKIDRADMFGMDEKNYRKVQEILMRPDGILYITGPTGSGKTTTLYMLLEWLKKKPVNIMTIEDPVEKFIDGMTQIQINEQANLTFERGLRAILRQDPDIIMIGETRDPQTARISARAAITGHLVLSTLHTKDAAGAIVRMLDLEVEPYMAANSISGIVAQRLARKVCEKCAKEKDLDESEAKRLGLRGRKIRYGTGCECCNGTGYKGRIAVHEVIIVDAEMRKMIAARCSAEEISEYVRKTQDVSTLKESIARLVEAGITTEEELIRLTCGTESYHRPY